MATVQTFSVVSFISLPPSPSPPFWNSTFLPKIAFMSRKITVRLRLSPSSLVRNCVHPSLEQRMLEAVSNSDEEVLPCIRTYENDLARLTLVGAVDFQQALTAAAADGGETADEHIASGMPAMVIETLFPGSSDDHSSVATRLFLPAKKVKERARKLKSSLHQDLSGDISRNILPMTFRQVVVEKLWSFELALFIPGSERDMEDLKSPREVPASFTVSSKNEKVISALAEALCIFALESTENQFVDGSLGRASNGFFGWLSKTNTIASQDSSVSIYAFENEVIANAKSLLEKFNSVSAKYRMAKKRQKGRWLTSLLHSKLEKIGGLEFSIWATEFVPAYKLQINADKHPDVKLEGWKNTMDNRWEVSLTHCQMVGLAEILDMFFEDLYTLPDKHLSCGMVESPKKLMKNKRSYSFWGILSTTLAGGIFLITVSLLYQLLLPRMMNKRRHAGEDLSLPLSDAISFQPISLNASELEAFCSQIIRKIKDYYGWNGNLEGGQDIGVWIGELPAYLRNVVEAGNTAQDFATSVQKSKEEMELAAKDIASYQVVLSLDGEIVGFQPMSRVAVNHWAANPLAKELYRGKNLAPGLLEPGLKISRPDEVIVLELLMSVNPVNHFALARPAPL